MKKQYALPVEKKEQKISYSSLREHKGTLLRAFGGQLFFG